MVPQNSHADIGRVEWQDVKNVTTIFRMPNITRTDNTIYIIMSLMTSSGSIIQAAAGLYQNMSTWGSYGMDIVNPTSYPQKYNFVLGSSEPEITPGHFVSLSLYVSGNAWNQKLTDLNSSRSINATFGASDQFPPTLRIGDQFVIAFESYTSNSTVFENMGNLTLNSVLVDGARVTGGLYAYSGWDNVHYPLFSVGGGSPPNFVSVRVLGNGSAVWSFSSGWSSSGSPSFPIEFMVVYLVAGAVAVLAVSLTAILLVQRRRGKANS